MHFADPEHLPRHPRSFTVVQHDQGPRVHGLEALADRRGHEEPGEAAADPRDVARKRTAVLERREVPLQLRALHRLRAAEDRGLRAGGQQRGAACVSVASCDVQRHEQVRRVDARHGGPRGASAGARALTHGRRRRLGLVDDDLQLLIGVLERQAAQRLHHRRVLASIDLAHRDAADDPVGIRVPQAGQEAPQLLLGGHRHGHARARAEQHGREVLDVRVREGAQDVFRDERERVGAEIIEVAQAGEQDEFREQRAAHRRQHEHLPEFAREHASQREFADRAAERGIDGTGRTARVDVAEHAEHDRARVGIDDAALHEPQFQHAARGRDRRDLRRFRGKGAFERHRRHGAVELRRDDRFEQPSPRVGREVLPPHLVRGDSSQRGFR